MKPVNYLDPYPYDDKIIELEQHHPKIKIDSIEARLYESNHPGDPMPQPVAKNFAMVYDAMLKQSANTEARLVKLENVLSQVLRSVGRIGSRVNVNCVYYGGQDTFGKYKTIRCLCDDRIHDACSVTLDQCLSCTRYEPILGQVYDILDDTGMNGSILLDNIQMGYQSLDDLKNLNRIEKRSTEYNYANVNNKMDKPKSQVEEWEKADKEAYINQLKKKTTDSKELEKLTKDIKQEDYAFKMNWYEQDLDLQEPDVKPYPLEGITKRYKKTNLGNKGEDDNDNLIDEKTSQDVIKDMTDIEKLNNGEWVDTREKVDTTESNDYSSEDYYFEGYNKLGETYTWTNSDGNGSVSAIFAADARKKIVEKAKEIVDLHAKGKAGYSQGSPPGNRTVDDTKRVIGSNGYLKNVFVYDCSSMVSCCYKYAGLNSMYNKTTYDQVREIVNKGGKMWLATKEGVKQAQPGDLIFTAESNVSQSMMGQYIPTHHVLIYIGDNKVAHASGQTRPVPKQIRIDPVDYYLNSNNFFARPKDLIDADANSVNNSKKSDVTMENGKIKIDGKEFPTLATIKGAVCTNYCASSYMGGGSTYSVTGRKYKDIRNGQTITVPTEGSARDQVKYCASHNLPFGTQVYIPKLKEKGLGDGILMVVDNGGHVFDFDINMTDAQANKFGGKQNCDVYVLKWGEDKAITTSFIGAARGYSISQRQNLSQAWRLYTKMNGKLISFWKFKTEDKAANIKSTLSPAD